MKKFIIFAIVALLVSCSNDPDLSEVPADVKTDTVVSRGMIKFNSTTDIENAIEQMKELDAQNVFDLIRTRTVSGMEVETDFVSLRQHLVDLGLREFTDAELAMIVADSLIYEPEDDLIVDPYMMEILNENREVQVDNNICRFVDEGLIMYDATQDELFDPDHIVQKIWYTVNRLRFPM